MGILKIHHNNLHQDIKYTCDTCDHQTASKGGLKKLPGGNLHAWNVTTGLLQRMEYDYQAATKGDVAKHQQSLHEGNKYECRECDHQTTS